jgi:hypothetical protein
MQLGQNQAYPTGMLRLNTCFAASEKKLFQPFVRKAFDHRPIVT